MANGLWAPNRRGGKRKKEFHSLIPLDQLDGGIDFVSAYPLPGGYGAVSTKEEPRPVVVVLQSTDGNTLRVPGDALVKPMVPGSAPPAPLATTAVAPVPSDDGIAAPGSVGGLVKDPGGGGGAEMGQAAVDDGDQKLFWAFLAVFLGAIILSDAG